MSRRRAGLGGTFVALVVTAFALTSAGPAQAVPRGQLGIFLHYGPASLVNVGSERDWLAALQQPSYLNVVASFKPNPAAAASWVQLAKDAGASYIVFTAKHQDGYTLWHSTVPVDRSAGANNVQWGATASQDVLATLAPACRAAGIKLIIYYSIIDQYEHAYRVSNADQHLAMEEAQLHEILTNYGPIAGVWLDGIWSPHAPLPFWHIDEIKQEIRTLQPNAQIAVNRFVPTTLSTNEDYSIAEKSIPISHEPWMTESTYPLGSLWYYSTQDHPKSARELYALFAQTIGRGFNLLVDVPPRGDGSIDPKDRAALLAAVNAARPKAVPGG